MDRAGVWSVASSGVAQSDPPTDTASSHRISTMVRGCLPSQVVWMICSRSWLGLIVFPRRFIGVSFGLDDVEVSPAVWLGGEGECSWAGFYAFCVGEVVAYVGEGWADE